MARYPTFEEYRKRGNFHDGLKRCDDLLKKNPNDVQLLVVKLRLLYATGGDAPSILQQLSLLQPPILDLGEISAIEDAVEHAQRDVYPQPNTAGPTIASLWDNAFKASNSMNHKLDLLSLRFSRAVIDHRLLDAQQALIQLKALQPRNRTIYMAHLAITQLLSSSKEDLQSRLALSLARKAVKDNFDEDKSLDCRVPGQVFALQASLVDLQSVAGRRFAESKQVYDACKPKGPEISVPAVKQSAPDAATVSPAVWLSSETQSLKHQFACLIAASAPQQDMACFAASSIRLFYTAKTSLSDSGGRGLADSCFLSISALVRMFELTRERRHLLHAAFLAETLLKHNPHIHEARMVLVYLYMSLSLGSLAMQMFSSLNIKEIQHDTVGHALFTRLSVTHPQSAKVSRRDVYDPQKKLSHAIAVYVRHEEKLAETEASVLNHEQTGMLFDLRDLRCRLRSSITRRVIYLEQRRIDRLLNNSVGEEPTQMGPLVVANWLDVTDSRDFTAGFNFGYNVEKVLHGRNNVLPATSWIVSGLVVDCAWCLSRGSELPVMDPKTLVEKIGNLDADLGGLSIDDSQNATGELTQAESHAWNLGSQLLKLLLRATDEPGDLKESIDSVLHALRALAPHPTTRNDTTFSEGLQETFVYIDILQIVLSACRCVGGKTSQYQSELREIQELAVGQSSALLRQAREQANAVTAAGVQRHMEGDELICETVKQCGDGPLKDFCSSIAASARGGWEGIALIKMD